MIRPSALAHPCGLAPRLAEQFPSTSEASERGTRLHAEFARALAGKDGPFSPGIDAAVVHVSSLGGAVSSELPCTLIDPETGETITQGTADVAIQAGRSLTVIDLKTGRQEGTAAAAENLQVHAYALGLALEANAVEYRTGILWLDHETGEVHMELSDWFTGADMWQWLDKIRTAASRPAVPTTGPHCTECRQRLHCPAYMLPAHEGESALAPFAAPGGLTRENAARALLVVEALEDAVKVAKDRLKDFARETGGIVGDDGKVWAPSTRKGRVSFDAKSFEADHPSLYQQYAKMGGNYEVFAWKKARP